MVSSSRAAATTILNLGWLLSTSVRHFAAANSCTICRKAFLALKIDTSLTSAPVSDACGERSAAAIRKSESRHADGPLARLPTCRKNLALRHGRPTRSTCSPASHVPAKRCACQTIFPRAVFQQADIPPSRVPAERCSRRARVPAKPTLPPSHVSGHACIPAEPMFQPRLCSLPSWHSRRSVIRPSRFHRAGLPLSRISARASISAEPAFPPSRRFRRAGVSTRPPVVTTPESLKTLTALPLPPSFPPPRQHQNDGAAAKQGVGTERRAGAQACLLTGWPWDCQPAIAPFSARDRGGGDKNGRIGLNDCVAVT